MTMEEIELACYEKAKIESALRELAKPAGSFVWMTAEVIDSTLFESKKTKLILWEKGHNHTNDYSKGKEGRFDDTYKFIRIASKEEYENYSFILKKVKQNWMLKKAPVEKTINHEYEWSDDCDPNDIG